MKSINKGIWYAILMTSARKYQEKEALRSSTTLWVLSAENTLEIRKVTVVAEDKSHICIDEGLQEDDHVIVSHIANPLQGMKLSVTAPDRDTPQKRTVTGEK